ncbi:MAG: photosystem II stability/assembly factor-like uncharacterized protein [Gammaproteobacteria bacterium]|jgi:photosystem II stability/assembly factor-like uncharacterized protein
MLNTFKITLAFFLIALTNIGLAQEENEDLNTSSWTELGPNYSRGGYYGSGKVICVGFHPSDNNIWWSGSPTGGLWNTMDNGKSWKCLTDNSFLSDNETVAGVSEVVIPSDYETSKTIYIATGDKRSCTYWSSGVYKSTDEGKTWNATGLNWSPSDRSIIFSLTIDPENNNKLYATTTNGIYRSVDGAKTWDRVYDGCSLETIHKPGAYGTLYTATNDGRVFVSFDEGQNWTKSMDIPMASFVRLAVTPANPNVVFAIVEDHGDLLIGVYKSEDSGRSFKMIYNGREPCQNLTGASATGCALKGSENLTIAISPADEDVLVIGGINTWRSIDGGYSWRISNEQKGEFVPAVHADKLCHVFRKNGDLFEGNDGGVYISKDLGVTWTDKTNDMRIYQAYRLAVSGPDVYELIAGFQDVGSYMFSGNIWHFILSGDGVECYIDPEDHLTSYASSQYGKIYRTDDHWNTDHHAFPKDQNGVYQKGTFDTPFVLDPSNTQTLYAGNKDVWKSVDQGESWEKISELNVRLYLNDVAIAPSNSNMLLAMDNRHIWATINGGGTWEDITADLPVSTAYLSSVLIKADDSKTIWVTLDDYWNPGVWKTIDGGQTWNDISEGLPKNPINCIRQNTLAAGVDLYVGTEFGVYFKHNESPWVQYENDLPTIKVNDLEIYYTEDPTACKLVAGTFGRGIWESPLFQVKVENDLGIAQIFHPESSSTLTANESVSVKCVNYGANSVQKMVLNYSINQGDVVSEEFNWELSGDAEKTFTFSQHLNLSSPGENYDIRVWVSLNNDSNRLNDTLQILIHNTRGDYLMDNTPVTTTGGSFFDSGGMTQVYSDNEQLVKTFTAGVPNSVLRFDFNDFDIENGIFSLFTYDWLYVYDGADTTAKQIEGSPFSGIIIPKSILSSGSKMTFKFISDHAATKNGWFATVSCQAIPEVDGKVLISKDLISYPYRSSDESISVDIWNEGSLDLQNFTVSYVLDDQNVVSEKVAGSIKSGEMVSYTFSKGVNFSEAGLDYKITAWLSILDDTNLTNDTSSVVIRNTLKDTVFLMSNESVTSSNCTFYDTGGPDDTYSGDEYFVKTFTTERSDERYIFEMYLDVELGYDFISIYDGKDTTSAAMLTNSSDKGTRIFESSGRSLTFKFNSDPGYNRSGWRADLKVVQVPKTDVSVKYLEAPITSTELGSSEKIGIWVYNSGSLAQKDVTVSYVVNQEETITETIHGIFPAMSDTLFYFQTTADLSGEGVKYYITTWSNTLNDENRENDTLFYGAQNTRGTPMSYVMNSTPVIADAGWFYDSGGPDERYTANENIVKTFTAKSSDSRLQFKKAVFELRRNDDYLMVFDGDNIYAPAIEGSPFHSRNVPDEIQSSGRSLTFQFGSDHWGQNNGWEFYFESVRVPAKNLKVISFKGLFDGPLSENEKIEINLFNGGFHHAFRGTAYYSINDGPAVAESITPLGGLQSGIHTFATSADLSEPGKEYSIKAWVEIEGHTPFEYDYLIDKVRNTTGDVVLDGINNLGGQRYRNDLVLVAITGTDLYNENHPLDRSIETSSYHDFSIEKNTTALLTKGETYELEVTSSLHYNWNANATISAWIDFDKDGEFEANEWIQVAWVPNFNVPNFVSFTVPENAVNGEIKMRIRTRASTFPNGADDANVNFGIHGVTEDYTITIE